MPMTTTPVIPGAVRRAVLERAVQAVGLAVLVSIVALSAMLTKEVQVRSRLGALAQVESFGAPAPSPWVQPPDPSFEPPVPSAPPPVPSAQPPALPPLAAAIPVPGPAPGAARPPDDEPPILDPLTVDPELVPAPMPQGLKDLKKVRWFNGRPIRPARTVWMTVTAYSPDWRSCGTSDDGITASLHSVSTNMGKLVAADTRLLPLGSMVSVPGYDGGSVVPVLDRGGAIKGARLDLLYPTHEQARGWGIKRLPVVVWEYADGKPAGDWRKIRDSRK